MQKTKKTLFALRKKYYKSKIFRVKHLILMILIFTIFVVSSSVLSKENFNSDTDSDYLTDIYEEVLGSNSNDSSDVKRIPIAGSYYLFVDTNDDNVSDVLFDINSARYNDIKDVDGTLYIDSDFDKEWDYTYKNNDLKKIEKNSEDIPWIFIIAGIIIFVIVLIILILFKKGILYIYVEEYTVDEQK